MGSFTSALALNTSTILQALGQSWNTQISSAEGKKKLQKYYPRTSPPNYDQYYSFPKESLVCIKVETSDLLSVDCYQSDVAKCSIDFSDALRRLKKVQQYTVDNLGYDSGNTSWPASLASALLPGGAILFVVGLLSSLIGIQWSLVGAVVYLGVYTLLKRENRI